MFLMSHLNNYELFKQDGINVHLYTIFLTFQIPIRILIFNIKCILHHYFHSNYFGLCFDGQLLVQAIHKINLSSSLKVRTLLHCFYSLCPPHFFHLFLPVLNEQNYKYQLAGQISHSGPFRNARIIIH